MAIEFLNDDDFFEEAKIEESKFNNKGPANSKTQDPGYVKGRYD